MSHYFTNDPGPVTTREVRATIFGLDHVFTTAGGVFSGSRLDPGTAVLLRTVAPPASGHILDLGCGFGPIAVGLAAASPGINVTAIDVNDRALELTRANAARAGVADRVHACRPEQVPEELAFDEIWSNPPIRIGKPALHELLLAWLPRLRPQGQAWLVVSRNLGSDSLAAWLTGQGHATTKEASAKGFRVLHVVP